MRTEQCQWTVETGWVPQAGGALGTTVQVVFLFGDLAAMECSHALEFARSRYPLAHLFGCTTGGEIQGTRVNNGSVALTAVAFDYTTVAVGSALIPTAGASFQSGVQVARSLPPDGLRHVILLSEGLHVNSCDLVEGVNSVLPPDITVSGGFAADAFRFEVTKVWCDGPPQGHCVIALGLYGGRLHLGLTATAGWDTFGLDRLVTRSSKNILYEFDGRPALALYKQYLGDDAGDLTTASLVYPLGVKVGTGQGRVLRTILAANEADQSITYAGNIPEGSYARLMRGNIEHLIDAADEAASASLRALGGIPPQLALVVSCNGRRPVLKQRIEEEIEAASNALGHPCLTGFYSYGEIAPAGSGPAQLHNETMTVLALAER